MTSEQTGGCLCGAVRYRAKAEPLQVVHCHCGMCQKASGAPFQTWVAFRSADLAFTSGAPAHYQSSEIARRGYCARCGTPLTFQYLNRPEQLSVTVGSLDDPGRVRPERHYWTSRQVAWLKLDDGLPRLQEEESVDG